MAKAAELMDKQILGLKAASASLSPPPPPPAEAAAAAFSALSEPLQEDDDDPSYDFHPIRSLSSNPKNAVFSPPPQELTKVSHEDDSSIYSTVSIAEIDRTVKKYTDNLMSALDGLTSKIAKLESRAHGLEDSFDELKIAIGNYNGSVDGRLRQFHNILEEVQSGVQDLHQKQILRDKEADEVRQQAAILQSSKPEPQPSQTVAATQLGPLQHAIVPTAQPAMQPQTQAPPSQLPMLPGLPVLDAPPQAPLQNPAPPQPAVPPVPNAPFPPPQLQNLSTQPQFPGQSQPPQSQSILAPVLPHESYFVPPPGPPEVPPQNFQPHVLQPQAPPAAPPSQQYQAPPLPPLSRYSEPAHPGRVNSMPPSGQLPNPAPQHPEETMQYSLHQGQAYQPAARPPAPYMQPSGAGNPPHYRPNPGMYEPPKSRPPPGPPPPYATGFAPPGGATTTFSDPYTYSGSPTHRGNSGPKTAAFSSGSNSFGQQLPKAQYLPQALPVVASTASNNSSSARVAVDDVIDKVTAMGFPRGQVRATVQKLTENGQNVDLNVVLDKLMNGGAQRW